jgi:hypothetical protein
MFHNRVALEGDSEKEPQRREGLIKGRCADASGSEMQLIAAHVLKACLVGRAAEECWVFGANLRIVMSSIMRRRNGPIASSVMGMLLS